MIFRSGKRKKCSATVLIRTQNDNLTRHVDIPSNMIIIDDYKIQLEHELEEMFFAVCVSVM